MWLRIWARNKQPSKFRKKAIKTSRNSLISGLRNRLNTTQERIRYLEEID
jgi:hypothetical protein